MGLPLPPVSSTWRDTLASTGIIAITEYDRCLIAYSKLQRFLDLPVLLEYPDLTFHQS
jgi:hypothetical protein